MVGGETLCSPDDAFSGPGIFSCGVSVVIFHGQKESLMSGFFHMPLHDNFYKIKCTNTPHRHPHSRLTTQGRMLGDNHLPLKRHMFFIFFWCITEQNYDVLF